MDRSPKTTQKKLLYSGFYFLSQLLLYYSVPYYINVFNVNICIIYFNY